MIEPLSTSATETRERAERGGELVYRHRLPTRLWHWTNAVAIIVLLMSGLMISNAHPHLYWGEYGANFDQPWWSPPRFPGWATIPSTYNLALARHWHLFFAWIGRAPKRLLVYRTSAPFRGIRRAPLEVLCLGQQFVAYADHPDTGQPYAWPEEGLSELDLDSLPVIDADKRKAGRRHP